MSDGNKKIDINKHEIDIDTLKKQNVNDLLSIKELYKRIEELGEKTSQIKYIDNTIVKKLKKEYEKLKKIILDENVQIELNNKIEETKTELTNNINEVNSQLDINLNNVKYVVRRFKPLVKFSPEFVKSNSNDNYLTVYSNDEIKSKIQKISKFNIDGLVWIGHVTVRNGKVEVYENVEKFKFAMNEARKYGLEITAIKFHGVEETTIEQIGSSKFFTEFKQLITSFINVPDNSIIHITVCNESPTAYYNTAYQTYFTDIMNFITSLGYKTGVTLTANDSSKSSNPNNAWIFNLSTNIYCNWYPSISNKLKKTTKTDCINGVNSSYRRALTSKETYNKPLIASECGIKNDWENLSEPADWTINGESSKGEVPRLYWYGVFESECYMHFDEIWIWYDKYLYYDETIKLFNYYLGGEK